MKNKLLLAVLALSIVFTACKKNKEEPVAEDPFKLGYSNLTVEEHKKNLETSGLDFMTKVNSMPDEKFIKVMKNLINLELELESNNMNKMMGVAEGASNKNIAKILEAVTNNETQKLSDNYGVYTYNATTKKWNITDSKDKLEINFPALENQTKNNAKIIMNYVMSGITTTIDDEKLELPKSASAMLLVDGKEEMKFTSAHEYKADGTPTKTDISLKMGSYIMAFNVANNTEVLTNSFSLSKGTETLFSFNSTGNGNMNVGIADGAKDAAEVVKNANANFEIMNVKFSGIFDIKGFSDNQKTYEKLPSKLEKNKKEVDGLNKFSQFVVINKTNNSIIAKTEFAAVIRESCYSTWNWNNATQNYTIEKKCNPSYDWEPRLVFKDGSKLSFEAFKENGFAKLIKDIEDYGDKFEL